MTELAEGIAIGTVAAKKVECPFHDDEHSHDDAKNELEGDATKLGKALVAGDDSSGTVVRQSAPDLDYRCTLRKEADPDERPESKREVQLKKGDEDTWYPVGFQAHHLIPAKESLARAKLLLTFIRKSAKSCCPLGYNVNGNQNGAWLPGKHAVDGNGLDLWKGSEKPGPDNEGAGRKKVTHGSGKDKWSYVELKGYRPGHPSAFVAGNMRWLYVQAAMDSNLGVRQFHDRHPTYSKAVLGHLNAMGSLLERFAGSAKKAAACPDCKEVKKGQRKPPVALLGALNSLSDHYHGMVIKRIEHATFYTSSWCDPARKKIGSPASRKTRPRVVKKK